MSRGFAQARRRLVNISTAGSMPFGLSRVPIVTKTMPGKLSRLLVNILAPQIGAKVSVEPLARLGNVVKRLRFAADQREVTCRHAKEGGRLSTGRLLAVQAVTDGDEGGISIEHKP